MKFKEIQVVSIDKIKPYPKNTKKHPQTQIDKLVKQLAQGFDQPIVVDKNFVIIKGHARYLAAQQMELEEVPIIMRDDLTDKQVKAIRIADNKIAESEWEIDILTEELNDLIDDFNLVDLGFSQTELDDLLGEMSGDEFDYEYGEDIGDDEESDDSNVSGDNIPESSVRMAQLFLDTKTHPLFIEMTDKLNELYGTDNPTDCVMAGLRELCQNHKIKLENA